MSRPGDVAVTSGTVARALSNPGLAVKELRPFGRLRRAARKSAGPKRLSKLSQKVSESLVDKGILGPGLSVASA
ncbi:hypothetical protein NSZ01_14830 [Nocardioides szechwanensis]|nr:hypothetical protein NSZ01_14830 [Nocardioides szechwanensis]